MMNYYFSLQLKRIFRGIDAFGIPASLGVFILSISFLAGSYYLFQVTEFASWIFLLFAGSSVLKMGSFSRVTMLQVFKKNDFVKIRILENLFVSIPFVVVFVFQSQFLFALGTILGALVLVFFKQRPIQNFTLPTPFKKIPFEYIVGFRKTFYMLFFVLFLMYKAVEVGNFNLGLFALGVNIALSLFFFMVPENVFYIWIYSTNSKGFLIRKIRTAVLGYVALTLPFALVLGLFFTDKLGFIIGAELLGSIYLVAMVLAKYSAFPKEIQLPQILFLASCLWFPPLLLVVIPYFYKQSIQKLHSILQ